MPSQLTHYIQRQMLDRGTDADWNGDGARPIVQLQRRTSVAQSSGNVLDHAVLLRGQS